MGAVELSQAGSPREPGHPTMRPRRLAADLRGEPAAQPWRLRRSTPLHHCVVVDAAGPSRRASSARC
jgi:hypothetical protein